MNPLVKEVWIGALLSGEYKQTRESVRNVPGVMRKDDSWCVLGVLLDYFVHAHDLKWIHVDDEDGKRWTIQTHDGRRPYPARRALAKAVGKWAGFAGLEHASGMSIYDEEWSAEKELQTEVLRLLIRLNDHGLTFPELARIIEVEL